MVSKGRELFVWREGCAKILSHGERRDGRRDGDVWGGVSPSRKRKAQRGRERPRVTGSRRAQVLSAGWNGEKNIVRGGVTTAEIGERGGRG
jgi:hypothetical protein